MSPSHHFSLFSFFFGLVALPEAGCLSSPGSAQAWLQGSTRKKPSSISPSTFPFPPFLCQYNPHRALAEPPAPDLGLHVPARLWGLCTTTDHPVALWLPSLALPLPRAPCAALHISRRPDSSSPLAFLPGRQAMPSPRLPHRPGRAGEMRGGCSGPCPLPSLPLRPPGTESGSAAPRALARPSRSRLAVLQLPEQW